ncbi:hypothetical protein Taro_001759 [Colocasia esculenta]|uniref:Uncharacterized protein n=1 Tax=Colocasia esculenta TaxID=4460 RepID=A0A843TC20_COLES|nr:hypothetical protein [Colocasia esculenta]
MAGKGREGAEEKVRRLTKEDPEAWDTLMMLGTIPPLVGMCDSIDVSVQVATLYALLNLGISNDMNKAAIVAVGTMHKMPKLIKNSRWGSRAIIANFLGLNTAPFQRRRDGMPSALFNLSLTPAIVSHLVGAGLVSDLFATAGKMEVSEWVLSVLFNVMSTREGWRAMSRSLEAFQILVDALNSGVPVDNGVREWRSERESDGVREGVQ